MIIAQESYSLVNSWAEVETESARLTALGYVVGLFDRELVMVYEESGSTLKEMIRINYTILLTA